jgi:hypothetical protein
MSREIKFRAMTKANNVMVFGDLIGCPNGEHRILWFEMKGELPLDVDYKSFNEPVQSSTIGQFTGIKDHKGVEIYEDDIVLGYTHPHTVIFADGAFYLSYKNSSVRLSRTCGSIEVIGNIYQNPELLSTI